MAASPSNPTSAPEQTDVRARAQESAGRIRTTVLEGLTTAKTQAAQLGSQAKQAVQSPENSAKTKGGGAAAGTTALAMAALAIRRRRNRRSLREKAASQVIQIGKRTAKKSRKAAPNRKTGTVVVLGTIAGLGVAYQVVNQNSTRGQQ